MMSGAVDVVKLKVMYSSSIAFIHSMMNLLLKPAVRSLPLSAMGIFSLTVPSSLSAESVMLPSLMSNLTQYFLELRLMSETRSMEFSNIFLSTVTSVLKTVWIIFA